MTNQPNENVVEFKQFFAELERVCPEAAAGLAFSGASPPILSRRDLIAVLQTLSDNAGVEAFLTAWLAFAAANPAAVIRHKRTPNERST